MKMRKLQYLIVILLMTWSCNLPQSKEKKDFRDFHKTEGIAEKDARMKWWRDAGFGMFIHWGLYSVPAGQYGEETNHAEWIQETADITVEEYEKYAEKFNPIQFDASEWVRLAKNAGMKYIVITSKHHDGFCLWDSEVSDYDIIDRTPYEKDLLKELADACKNEGIILCFYHSIMDWHHPDAQGINHPDYNYGTGPNPNFTEYVENYMTPQLEELLNNYGKIGVLWFDGEWISEWTEEQGTELYNYLRNIQPDLIINNRVGKGRQGMEGMNAYENAAGDFGTPEQEILEGTSNLDWESCMTMNDHWGFNKFNDNFKSTEMLIHNLVDIAAKGGNYLLNVGPTPEGLIPEKSIYRLREIGQWMKVNGEVIHNSRGTKPYQQNEHINYIRSNDDKYLYAVLTHWPGESVQLKYAVPDAETEINLLGFDKPLEWEINPSAGMNVDLPEAWQNEENRPVKYAWVIKMEGHQAKVAESPDFYVDGEPVLQKAVFADTVVVSLVCPTKGAQIYYSVDGRAQTSKLNLYTKPVSLWEPACINALAIKDGYVTSPASEVSFLKAANFKAINYTYPYNPKYSAMGDLSLGDGLFGSEKDIHENWLGFEGEDMIASIDLGEREPIGRVNVNFLQDTRQWIFMPEEIEVSISDDGINYIQVAKIANEQVQGNSKAGSRFFRIDFTDIPCRFVRVKAKNIARCPEWHPGAGGKAWLFVDEIIIE